MNTEDGEVSCKNAAVKDLHPKREEDGNSGHKSSTEDEEEHQLEQDNSNDNGYGRAEEDIRSYNSRKK